MFSYLSSHYHLLPFIFRSFDIIHFWFSSQPSQCSPFPPFFTSLVRLLLVFPHVFVSPFPMFLVLFLASILSFLYSFLVSFFPFLSLLYLPREVSFVFVLVFASVFYFLYTSFYLLPVSSPSFPPLPFTANFSPPLSFRSLSLPLPFPTPFPSLLQSPFPSPPLAFLRLVGVSG